MEIEIMMEGQSLIDHFSVKQRMMQKYAKHNFPVEFILELTHRCNLQCVQCYIVRENRPELSTVKWKSVIDQLAELKCFEIVLTGGESLVRDDFFDIAYHARELHFAIVLYTNATLITEEIASEIQKFHPKLVEVSIYGTPATDERITQVKGSFERSIKGIQHLLEHNIKTTIKVNWTKETYNDADFLMSLSKKYKTNFRGNVLMNFRRDGSAQPLEHCMDDKQLYKLFSAFENRNAMNMTDDEKKEFTQKIIHKQKEPHIPAPCGAGRAGLCISANGDVYPCVGLSTLKLGNVHEKNIKEIWENSDVLAKVRNYKSAEFHECHTCGVSDFCTLCPGDNLLQGKKYTECNPESRRIATIMKKAAYDVWEANKLT